MVTKNKIIMLPDRIFYKQTGLLFLLWIIFWLSGCSTTTIDIHSVSVAYSTKSDTHWAPFLVGNKLNFMEMHAFDASGKRINTIFPIGKAALGPPHRPAIAYGSNNNDLFLVVFAESVGFPNEIKYQRVAARFVDGNGKLHKSAFYLFDDKKSTIYSLSRTLDVSPLQVTYNSILDEFLVTAQRTVSGDNGIWAQRISFSKGLIGAPLNVINKGPGGIISHAVAYAPVAGTVPAGGRYLLAYGSVNVELLDSHGKSISIVPLDLGYPSGKSGQPDVSYGVVDGKKRFLLVYSDGNNCKPGTLKSSGGSPCPQLQDQWTGVWGTYIDPDKSKYAPGAINSPFPISSIWSHHAGPNTAESRVTYNTSAKAFFVVWRELPVPHTQNDEDRSHIRGNKVDYFVPDGMANSSQIKKPHTNIVISTPTGNCKPAVPCMSIEDPHFPDVTAVAGDKVAVHWHERSVNQNGQTELVLRNRVISIP